MNKNTRTIYNTFTYMVAFISGLAISFVLTPYLVSTFGKETYSFYTIATNISSYMITICNALNIMSSRYISIEIRKNNFSKANDYFKSIFASNFIICLLISVPMVWIVVFLDRFMDVPDNARAIIDIKWMFAFVFMSVLVKVMASLYSICTVARDRIDLRAYKEISAGILKLLFIFLAFALFTPQIKFIGIVLFFIACYNAIIQFFYTRIITPELKLKYGNFKWEYVREILISSVWNTLTSLGGNLLSGIAIILINILISAQEASYVSIVHTLIGLLNGLITVFMTAFYPRMLHAYTENRKNFANTTMQLQRILSIFTNVAIVGVILMGDDFYRLWMPNVETDRLVLVTNIQLIAVFFTGNVYLFNSANTLALKIKFPAVVLFGLAVFNILGSIVAKSMFDVSMIGLLLFNVIVNSLYYLVFIPLYVRKHMMIKVSKVYVRIVTSIIACAVSLVVCGGLDRLIIVNGWVLFFLKAFVIGAVTLIIVALCLGLFKVKKPEINK